MHTPFLVEVVVQSTHSYVVEANYAEEAEGVAQDWLEEGDEGQVTDKEIVSVSAIPADSAEVLVEGPGEGEDLAQAA